MLTPEGRFFEAYGFDVSWFRILEHLMAQQDWKGAVSVGVQCLHAFCVPLHSECL
jgi:hypothetical protein